MNMATWNEEVSIKRGQLEQLRFYGFAGICIIRFQQLDNHLQRPFSSLVHVTASEGEIIFGAIRTVDRRCGVLSKLIGERVPPLSDRWGEIVGRIRKAEKNRNSIAHGLPIFGGGKTTVQLNTDTNAVEIIGHEESFHYLTKQGFDDWTTSKLLEESHRTENLLKDLYVFCDDLSALLRPQSSSEN
jgi:hypothetical protein